MLRRNKNAEDTLLSLILVDTTPRVESTNRSRKISSAFMKLI
jgi:hypothetical protein